MPVRVLTRTHYQVDEPAFVRQLVLRCTSPTRSEYPERVAQRLDDHMKAAGREFNLPAAKYCVDLAKGLGLLTDNNVWTDHAQTLHFLSAASISTGTAFELELSKPERIFFFRLFLEYDGAALLFFAHLLRRERTISQDWNVLANEMMVFIYDAYLEVVTDIAERSRLRHSLEKRVKTPYGGKSGSHQCFVHLQSLMRMGLLERSSAKREYVAPAVEPSLQGLLAKAPDVRSLDRAVTTGQWPEITAAVFGARGPSRVSDRDTIMARCRAIYARVMSTGVTLCSLRTLTETIQTEDLAEGSTATETTDILNVLREAQAVDPKRVRFHVDRIGRPAFVTFDAASGS